MTSYNDHQFQRFIKLYQILPLYTTITGGHIKTHVMTQGVKKKIIIVKKSIIRLDFFKRHC